MSDGGPERIEEVLQSGAAKRLIELTVHAEASIATPGLFKFANSSYVIIIFSNYVIYYHQNYFFTVLLQHFAHWVILLQVRMHRYIYTSLFPLFSSSLAFSQCQFVLNRLSPYWTPGFLVLQESY